MGTSGVKSGLTKSSSRFIVAGRDFLLERYIYYMIILMVLSESDFRRLVSGDPEMIEVIYEEYQKAITTYFIVRTFGNRSIAEDLVHETFCSIMESVHRLKKRETISLWIFTIAKRTLIKYQRKLFRRRKYMNIMKERYEEHPDVVESIQKKQKLLLFTMALDSLKPEYRKIFDLRYDERLPVKAIAARTGRTEKSVENILRRIKTKLKQTMIARGESFFAEEVEEHDEA
ncbi:MAG: sigma-70 family RNA polymerase sigma factor [Spirochaetales bacterium]|nr:sigma-70 family RNA polymerase sigma factor [Spirochaetales bacterium]